MDENWLEILEICKEIDKKTAELFNETEKEIKEEPTQPIDEDKKEQPKPQKQTTMIAYLRIPKTSIHVPHASDSIGRGLGHLPMTNKQVQPISEPHPGPSGVQSNQFANVMVLDPMELGIGHLFQNHGQVPADPEPQPGPGFCDICKKTVNNLRSHLQYYAERYTCTCGFKVHSKKAYNVHECE